MSTTALAGIIGGGVLALVGAGIGAATIGGTNPSTKRFLIGASLLIMGVIVIAATAMNMHA